MDAVSGRKFPTINPADGTVITEISEGDKVKFPTLINYIITIIYYYHRTLQKR